MRPLPNRQLSRRLACVAVLLLGVLGARRLELGWLPDAHLPQLDVRLTLAEGSDVETLTRRWLLPIEAAIRATGGVRATRAWVSSTGAQIEVRLEPGEDARRRAARLESEIARLRATLPQRGQIDVLAAEASAGTASMVLWFEDSEGAGAEGRDPAFERHRLAIEGLPEVRAVTAAGSAKRTLRIEPVPAVDPGAIEAAIRRALTGRRLGGIRQGDHETAVVASAYDKHVLEELPIRLPVGGASTEPAATVVALRDIARVTWHEEEPAFQSRVGGRSGRALFIEREAEATALALHRAIERYRARESLESSTHILLDEALPLINLLERLLLGLLAATAATGLCAGAVFGWRAATSWVLVVPVALASVVAVLGAFGARLDVTTLPMVVLAIAAAPLVYAWRSRGQNASGALAAQVAAAFLLPAASALGAQHLAPFLLPIANTFFVAVIASALSSFLVPSHRAETLEGSRTAHSTRRWVRASIAHAGAWVLAAVSLGWVCFALAGSSLLPKTSRLDPPLGDLAIRFDLGESATPALARERVDAMERHLTELTPVESFWSGFNRRGGSILVDIEDSEDEPRSLARLARRLEIELGQLRVAVRVVPLVGAASALARPVSFADELVSKAETDRDATLYRTVLRSTRLAPLRIARARHEERLAIAGIRASWISTEWAAAEPLLELRPTAMADNDTAVAVISELRRRTTYPWPQPLPADRDLDWQVLAHDAPRERDDVTSVAVLDQVLDLPGARTSVVPSQLFDRREIRVEPSVMREGGRFVLPIDAQVNYIALGLRREVRESANRSLGASALAPGVELERPELHPFLFDRQRVEMIEVATLLPALLLVLGAVRLNSIVLALVAFAGQLLAVGAVAGWLRMLDAEANELTLLTIAATLCLTALPAWQWLARTTGSTQPPGRIGERGIEALYRVFRRHLAAVGVGSVSLVVAPCIGAIGLSTARAAWVEALGAAAITASVALFSSALLVPALVAVVVTARRYDRAEASRRRRPPAWLVEQRSAAPLRLQVRSLNKTYAWPLGGRPRGGARDPRVRGSGFRALHRVDFDLGPGITGLLGPNGAGKTTLLRLLAGVLEPTRGRISFRGVAVEPINLAAFRTRVGFLPQDLNAWPGFTVESFLEYWALERGLLGAAREREIGRVLELADLGDARFKQVRELSGGMRRRAGIARALLGDPPILIVDEPTTGLDIDSRNRLRRTLLDVAASEAGRIVLFSTHIASDLAAAAHRILVVHEGRLLFDGMSAELIDRAEGSVWEATVSDSELFAASGRYRVTTRVREAEGVRLRMVIAPGETPLAGATPRPARLEEAYLALLARHGVTRLDTERPDLAAILDLPGRN